MENTKPNTEETNLTLETMYLFTTERYEEQWRGFYKSLFWVLRVLALVLIASSITILLQSQRYKVVGDISQLISITTKLEVVILVGGFLSTCVLFVLLLVSFFDFLDKAVKTVGKFLENAYYRLIDKPVTRLFSTLFQWITKSIIWKFPSYLGKEIGFKYYLYPAIPVLEPETDRRTLKKDTLTQLPPKAYTSEQFCDATLEKYFNFTDGTILLLPLVWIGALIISFFLATIINNLGIYVIRFLYVIHFLSASLSNLLNFVLLLATVIVLFIGYFAFILGTIKPFGERRQAWINCKYELQQRRELEEQAINISHSIAERLQANIEKLQLLYAKEYETVQMAMEEREQAIKRLKHLVEQPDMNEQTLNSVLWLMAYGVRTRPTKKR